MAPPARGTAPPGARAARRGSTALLLRREAEAAEQLLLARDRLGAGDLPGTARRSNRNSTARCQASSRESGEPDAASAYSRRVAGVIAPRSTSTLPPGARVGLLRRLSELLTAVAAAASHQVVAAACSSARARPGQRLGVPGPDRRGLSAASLRIDARACSVSRLNAAWGTRGGPCGRSGCRPCRSSRTSARGGRTRGTARSGRARGPGGAITRKPATSSPSVDRAGDRHGAAVPESAAAYGQTRPRRGERARGESSAGGRRPRRLRGRPDGRRRAHRAAGAAPRWSACAVAEHDRA